MDTTENKLVEIVPILEQICPECSGAGFWLDKYGDGDNTPDECSSCDGTGYVLTGDGRRLLNFYRHHIARLRVTAGDH